MAIDLSPTDSDPSKTNSDSRHHSRNTLNSTFTEPAREAASAAPAVALRALRHRWKLVVLIGLIGAVIGFAIDHVLPPPQITYSTHALIRIEPAETLPGTRPEARDLRTQAELIKTRFVLSSALEQGPAAALDSVKLDLSAVLKRLTTDLKVEPVGPQILRISLTGSEPEELTILVNAVKDAYLREVVGNEQVRRTRRKEFLEAAYRDCDKRLSEKRAELKPKTGTPEHDDPLSFARFALLQKELLRIELELQRSRLELALDGRNKAEAELAPAVVEDLAEKDPLIRQYRALNAPLDDRIAHWEKTATNPQDQERYRNLLSERQTLNGAIDIRKRELSERYAEMSVTSRRTRSGQIQERAIRLEEEEKLIRGLVERSWDGLKTRTKTDPEFTLTQFEVERLEVIAKQLLDELAGLRLENNAVARTASLQDAAEPVVKNAGKQLMRTGIAALAPLCLAVLCISAWEVRSRRIYGPEDVRNATGTRVLGVVPRLCGRRRTDEHSPSATTDSVDALGTLLLRDQAPGDPRVLMITSAVPREGKSTLARCLAMRLASAGKKTLLLDADLYRPTAHAAFDLPVGPGLNEVLCGTLSAATACQLTTTEDLFVLTAGIARPQAFREMLRGSMNAIIADLRTAFDVIVIDTSPVLATAQPLLVGRFADAVVVSTLCALSRSTLVMEAIRRLADLSIPVAGVVVNGAPEASRYGYYFRSDRRKSLAMPMAIS